MDRKRALRAGHGLLELVRPPNLVTAAADVAAGLAIAGSGGLAAAPVLVLASMALYAGGVALNDVCDAPLDARERPERPIPSGRVSRRSATTLALGLLTSGVALASLAGPAPGAVALAIALMAALYDARAKHEAWGPVAMGLCRGLNLLLGLSAVPAQLVGWPVALVLVAYIAGVTLISRGEVHGGTRRAGATSLVLVALAGAGLVAMAPTFQGRVALLPFLVLLAVRVLPSSWRAFAEPCALNVRDAVRQGLLSLVVLDAAIVAAYAGPLPATLLLALALVARGLARRFAVT